MMLNGLYTQGRRDMGFAGTGPADKHDILGVFYELTQMQLADQRLIDLTGSEVISRQVLASR